MAGYGYNYGSYSASNGLAPSYAPNQNNGQYYTANKTESYSPLLNEYRQSSPVRYRQPSNPVPYQPDSYRPVNTSYSDQTPNSYQVGTTGDRRSGEWSKPKGNMINNGVSDGYNYRKTETDTKPEIINAGGWPRPNKAMWATPPEASVRKPTTDINTAFEFMKEAAKASGVDSSNSRYAIPEASTGSRMHGKKGAVDENEGKKRYSNLNFLSRAKEAYKGANEVYKGISVKQSAAKK